ncbi:hypothetical protein TEMA_11350 [Terrisporobacter mayombei]|uniref:DUF11 domain-containing protein n=2 Tax=Terrisporobacter mayombei TaxID=1541 RepID=A0ABY9PYM0_9FIRM|nr:hypothetical protein TEMA_11350 [Terrisporobacter mayombei]
MDGGSTFNLWTGRLNLGTLPAGVSTVILISGTVKPTRNRKIINIADVISTTPDPNLNNNTATASVEVNQSSWFKDGCCDDRHCNN